MHGIYMHCFLRAKPCTVIWFLAVTVAVMADVMGKFCLFGFWHSVEYSLYKSKLCLEKLQCIVCSAISWYILKVVPHKVCEQPWLLSPSRGLY